MWFCVIFLFFLRTVHFPKNYMLFKSLLRIAWVMTSQPPFCKMEEKVSFIDFIEIFQSKMKRLHVNKGFYLLILEKIVDSMLNYSQLSSRLYTLMTAFLTLQVLEWDREYQPDQWLPCSAPKLRKVISPVLHTWSVATLYLNLGHRTVKVAENGKVRTLKCSHQVPLNFLLHVH